MNKIKRFIKWVIDETKGIYYDIKEWNVKTLTLFSGSCVFSGPQVYSIFL